MASSSRRARTQLRLLLFFFNDTATTEIYTLSLHDALPISHVAGRHILEVLELRLTSLSSRFDPIERLVSRKVFCEIRDRKSTRLNSSHSQISYAVFCLKKKKKCTAE